MQKTLKLFLFLVVLSSLSFAQAISPEKLAVLKPPPGQKVAIVIFEDLECPDCARAHPLVKEISAQERIPVVRHDFPLAQHTWAMQAAIMGRYFDTKSAKMGDDWRTYIFANQNSVSADNLGQFFQKFAEANGGGVPMVLDPGGRLEAKVKADVALGKRIGIQHTPTLWVVGNTGAAEPFVEVIDRSNLRQIIQDMRAKSKETPTAKASKAKGASR